MFMAHLEGKAGPPPARKSLLVLMLSKPPKCPNFFHNLLPLTLPRGNFADGVPGENIPFVVATVNMFPEEGVVGQLLPNFSGEIPYSRQLRGLPKVIYPRFCGKIRLHLLSPGNGERIVGPRMSESRIRRRPIWLLPKRKFLKL